MSAPASTSATTPSYRLADRRTGTALLGLSVPQLGLAATGAAAVVLTPAVTRHALGLLAGVGVAALCAALAFLPAGGQPAHEAVWVAVRFVSRRIRRRQRWVAPLPLLTGTADTSSDRGSRRSRQRPTLPACLAGLELHAVDRPRSASKWTALAPVGLIRDRRSGTATAVLAVRGGPFSLLEPVGRHAALARWAGLLSRFAAEASPVTRLGWSLWSAPAPPAEHWEWLQRHAAEAAREQPGPASDYQRLLAEATHVWRHDLRVWITVDLRHSSSRTSGRSPSDPADAALAAAQALADRCVAAGLVVEPPLSPVEIAEAMRIQADPSVMAAMARVRKGLAELVGMASVLRSVDQTHAGPLAIHEQWDAVRVDGAWHRVFWIAQWPALGLDPGWLDPLILAPPCVRALTVIMEPITPRSSRRRINAESVSIESQLRLRERHAFRVPVELQRAHADVDQREAELHAGFSEFAYLALVAVTGRDLVELDANCQAILDQAAQCGVTELRPLHGRHAAAWACTLPIGRAPDRQILRGGLG